MKKILFIMLLGCLLLTNIKVSASGVSELLVNYYDSDVYKEYLQQSSEFEFDVSMLKEEKIAECLKQINVIEDYDLEFIYNIFGEAQYLLIESKSSIPNAYIIYDFMLEEAIEYSDNRISDWSNNELAQGWIKIYLNLDDKFYLNDVGLYNVYTDELISEITDLNDVINVPDYAISLLPPMDEIRINRYNNKMIKEEYDINNAFFFKNFYMDERYNFNQSGSCVVVSTALLLSYYDVFYNDNIVSDVVTYKNTSYLTRNNLAQDIFAGVINNGNGSKYTDRFYIDTWNQTNYKQTGVCEFDNSFNPDKWYNSAGPTKEFHDCLVEIARDNSYLTNNGMLAINSKNLINDFLTLEGVEDIKVHTNYSQTDIIDCLKNNIPVIIGSSFYEYYYEDVLVNNNTQVIQKGVRGFIKDSHSVIAYGYQKTSIGTFYHVNMGWKNKIENGYYENNSDVYMNVYLMGFHTYIDVSNLEHVCSNQYQLYDSNLDLTIPICPCQILGQNMNFISYDNDYDYVDINNDNIYDVKFLHQCDDYQPYNENYHIAKCRLYDNCGKSVLSEHDFSIIGKSDDQNHYIKCRDCGYTKYESHLDANSEYYNYKTHAKYCSFCLEYHSKDEHQFKYVGNDTSHIGTCMICQYEQQVDTHELEIIDHSTRNHKYKCSCGYLRYEAHTYNGTLNCTVCNHEHTDHAYTYSRYSSTKHYRTCPCGEENYEPHSYVSDGITTRCRYCGYQTTGNVIVYSNPVADEILYINNQNYYAEVNRDEE